MPARNPTRSPSPPTMSGMMAPPMMPVTSIPEKLPWCSATELSAREKITGHMTAAKKPTAGNVIRATGPDRASAAPNARTPADGHEPPEPGHRAGAGGPWIVTVIGLEEFGHPVGDPLLQPDVH